MNNINSDLAGIENMIYTFRGQRVMIDSDLSSLYGVETKILNRQVRRNYKRFPEDFMFQLTQEEFRSLKKTMSIAKVGSGGKHKMPLVFTENGVAMLSGILNSDRAILVNISIMRIFTKLRSFLMMEGHLENRMDKLEQNTNQVFKIVFERLDGLETDMEEIVRPKLAPARKKIGLK